MIEALFSGRILRISDGVQDIFRKYQQKTGENEAGGILLGFVYNDSDEIIQATEPHYSDSRGLTFFIRKKQPAQRQVNSAWVKSSGSLVYLGEWHTHSQRNPRPSTEDRDLMAKVISETLMDIDYVYMIIVGTDDYWIGIQTPEGLKQATIKHRRALGGAKK